MEYYTNAAQNAYVSGGLRVALLRLRRVVDTPPLLTTAS